MQQRLRTRICTPLPARVIVYAPPPGVHMAQGTEIYTLKIPTLPGLQAADLVARVLASSLPGFA